MSDGAQSASLIEQVLFFTTSLLSTGALFFFLQLIFSERELREKIDSPASHFALREVRSARTIRYLSAAFALPFAALFFVLCLKARTLVDAAKEALGAHVGSLVDKGGIAEIIAAVPWWLNPLFVLAGGLLLFAPVIRKPFVSLQGAIVRILDLDDGADATSIAAAKFAAQELGGFSAVAAAMQDYFKTPAPLPRKLVPATEDIRLAYQLIYFSRSTIVENGLEDGLKTTLSKIDIDWDPDLDSTGHTVERSYGYAFAAITFYAVLCACYVVFAPAIAPWLQDSLTVRAWLQQIEWPQFRDELGLLLAQRTLSFILPLACGMYLFSRRRAQRSTEPPKYTFVFLVANLQVAFALFVNFAFAVVFAAQVATGENSGAASLVEAKQWGNILVFSLTPAAAFLAWVLSGRLGVGTVGTLIVICLAAAVAFCGSQYAYEAISEFRGFYWHQMVLGAFITMSYGLAALLAGGILPLEPTPKSKGVGESIELRYQG